MSLVDIYLGFCATRYFECFQFSHRAKNIVLDQRSSYLVIFVIFSCQETAGQLYLLVLKSGNSASLVTKKTKYIMMDNNLHLGSDIFNYMEYLIESEIKMTRALRCCQNSINSFYFYYPVCSFLPSAYLNPHL